MRASGLMNTISRETLRQSFIKELQARGINETKEGIRLEEADYNTIRSELALSHFRETNVESSSNAWF